LRVADWAYFLRRKEVIKSMRVFKRGDSWYADYDVGGKRKMRSFGKHRKMAELSLKDIELKSVRGELCVIEDKISLSQFTEKYLEYSQLNKTCHSYKVDLGRIRILQRFCGERGVSRLPDINPRLMEDFKSVLLKRCKPRTVNHYLVLIKAMLNKAVEWRHLRENPLKGFKNLKDPGLQEPRYLSRTEIERILNIADPVMRNVIRILLYTGMRRSELVYLTWEDVDFQNKRIRIQSKPESGFHPKSYKPRSIPMNKELEQIFLDLVPNGKYVFDNRKG
jgi:integrase